ncbi:MAG: nucleoside deaminase, partial [Nocardioides sp.]
MLAALAEARAALTTGDVPIGAVVLGPDDGV